MSTLRLRIGSIDARFSCVIAVAMTIVSAIAGDLNPADAAWWPLHLSRKSAEDAEPRSNSGFSGTIRKLLADAKAQEEQGNLDKAIALADRAAKMSESTSPFVKPAPDVSPSVTARYARDLRLKKAEQSVKRKDIPPTEEKVAQKDRSASKAKPNRKDLIPSFRKNLLVSDRMENPDTPKKKDPTIKSSVVATERRKPKTTSPKASEAQPAPDKQSFVVPVANSEVPVTKPRKPDPATTVTDDDWDIEDPFAASNAPPPKALPHIVADDSEMDELFVDDDRPISNSVAATKPDDEAIPPKPAAAPEVLKLRKQYSSSIFEEVLGIAQAGDSKSGVDEKPAITPKSTGFQKHDSQDQPKTAVAFDEIEFSDWDPFNVSENDSPRTNDPEGVDKLPSVAASNDDFPVDRVNILRDRLLSAASLEPGAVSPEVIMTSSIGDQSAESTSEPTAEEPVAQPRPFRLRKRRQSSYEELKQEATAARPSSARQSVSGQASVVQWRPAKSSLPVISPETKKSFDTRTVRQPDDIRTSLRDVSMTAFESSSNSSANNVIVVPTVDFGGSHARQPQSFAAGSSARNRTSSTGQVRGSIWDNAEAPSSDTGAVNFNSTNLHETASSSTSLAPLPPPDVELSSIHPNQLISDHSGKDEFLSALDQSLQDDEAVSTTPTLATTRTKRTGKTSQIASSSVWIMFSAVGFTALVSGLWMIRVTMRPMKSPKSFSRATMTGSE